MAETIDWNKRFETIQVADLEYVEKSTNDILDDIGFESEIDRLLCKDIVQHLENTAAEEILNNKCIQIPFIGCLRKNPLKQVLEDNRKNFRIIAQNYSKEERKEKYAEVFRNKKAELRKEDYYKARIKKLRRKYKTKYEQYFTHVGPAYAEMFIASRLNFSMVEFNKELEDKLQELYNE